MKKKNPNWRIAVVVSRFNNHITERLLRCCVDELVEKGVRTDRIETVWVPGAYELAFMANELASARRFDGIICLGCIIKGETSHDVHIATWCALGIGQASLAHRLPVMFGVLTPNSEAQALKRAKPGPLNRGKEVAEAAIEMIQLKSKGSHGR